jgi:hypothetical protein
MACHHWISAWAEASPAASNIAPAASQPKPIEFLIAFLLSGTLSVV